MAGPSAREFFFPDASRTSEAALEIEARFFERLLLANGTFKTTGRRRLADLDTRLAALLAPGSSLRILDAGISSGITTLELLDALTARGVSARVVAVDLYIDAYLRRVAGGLDVLYDASGTVLQLARPPFVRFRPIAPRASLKGCLAKMFFDAAQSLFVPRGQPVGRGATPVTLLSPRLADRPEVEVVQHDLTRERAEWRRGFDVVRVANLLNTSYFDEKTLRSMLASFVSYLRPQGLLAVCRTLEDGSNHATIFRAREMGGLDVVARLGNGSEVEALALALAQTRSSPSLTEA